MQPIARIERLERFIAASLGVDSIEAAENKLAEQLAGGAQPGPGKDLTGTDAATEPKPDQPEPAPVASD